MYILKNNNTNQYIGIDQSSGGYPYDTSITGATKFETREEALSYKEIFNYDWSLFKVEFKLTEIK